ncbi:unnamed protein product, partial [Allacma fusca]
MLGSKPREKIMKNLNCKMSPPVTIFKNTLNLYPFMLVTPYFITYCKDQETVILRHANIIVKVAFVVIQTLAVVLMCCKVFKQFSISLSLNATPILALSLVAWLALNIIVLEFVWRRTSYTLDMLNLLSDIYEKCTQFDFNGRTVGCVLDILDQFQLALKHASDSLGLLYLMVCVAFLPYYCLALPILFGGHALRVAEVVWYSISVGLATFPAAQAHNL